MSEWHAPFRSVRSQNPLHPAYWLGTLDPRPVALFRICFGLLLLKDALYHVPLAAELYSDAGLLPRTALFVQRFGAYRFSLMDALGPPALVVAFFVFQAAVAACLALGYRTRLAAVLSWILLVSVHYRNGYLLDGGDAVFRVMALWAIFMPLGERYSLDSLARRLRSDAPPASEAWAFPVRLGQLQVALIYFATAEIKLREGSWWSGDALFYTRQLESLLLPWGAWSLHALPESLLRASATLIVAFEWAFPFLVLLPVGQPLLRRLGLGGGLLLHGAIGLTMAIPNFSLLLLSSYWLFVDASWIEALARRMRSARGRARLARPGLRAPIRPWLLAARELEADPEPGAYADPEGWWLVTPEGERREGAAAWRALAGHLVPSPVWRWVFSSAARRAWLWRVSGRAVERAVSARAATPAPRLAGALRAPLAAKF